MSPTTRTERDSLGEIEVPADRYWGAQTQRCLQHFAIGDERMPRPLICALGLIKQVSARVHVALGQLDPKLGGAIEQAAGEVARGELEGEFLLPVWQTGSGTQTHMNANEVIASRANEIMTGTRGGRSPVHPNDHVNLGQSSNDTIPTAMHVASVTELESALKPALRRLHGALAEKAVAFGDVVKIGRTHLQDAVPLTVGQELSGWARQVELALARIDATLPHLCEVAQGGTAIGTGLNARAGFAERFASELARVTGLPFVPATNRFEAIAAHDAVVESSGALNTIAASLHKIAGDLRLLASGPRCGLGELVLPSNEPGSSIMPGKVNPTQAEAMSMVSARVIGNHATITFAGAQGQLQLQTYKPVILHAHLQSIRLLADASGGLAEHCVEGLRPNEARLAEHVARSLMLVTALAPHIGYDAAAAIADRAAERGTTLREAAVDLGAVTPEQFDVWVQPSSMTRPQQ